MRCLPWHNHRADVADQAAGDYRLTAVRSLSLFDSSVCAAQPNTENVTVGNPF